VLVNWKRYPKKETESQRPRAFETSACFAQIIQDLSHVASECFVDIYNLFEVQLWDKFCWNPCE